MRYFIFATLFFALLFSIPGTAFAAYTWTETQPAGASNESWLSSAADSDGSVLLVGESSGRLYLSTNSGSSWSETQPAGAVNVGWHDLAIDSDGSVMLADASGGRLYLSTTTASTWTETQPAGAVNKNWDAAAADADGTHLIAGVGGSGRLYLSTTTGSTWTEVQPAGAIDRGWEDADISDDGTKMIAVTSNGQIYYSTTTGSTWTNISPASDQTWNWVEMSADGQKIIAVNNDCDHSEVYVSTNAGSSWSTPTVSSSSWSCWAQLGADSALTNILVSSEDESAAGSGHVYVSTNSGTSWTETRPAGNTTAFWYLNEVSGDGLVALAGAFSGRLYLGALDTTGPTVSSFSPADDASGVVTDTNLIITFSESVATSSGNITIVRADTGATVETIAAGSALISISSTTVTINPSATLEPGTEHYITIASGVFEDSTGNDYAGINNATTWNFTTVAVDGDDGDEGTSGGSHRGGGSSSNDDDEDEDPEEEEQADDDTTPATLQEVINTLRILLAELQARGVTLPPQAAPYLLPATQGGYTRDLTLGSQGADVIKLQLYLIAQNKGGAAQALAANGATGYFGPLTRAALAEFQAAVGITPAAGYFGPLTRGYIASH